MDINTHLKSSSPLIPLTYTYILKSIQNSSGYNRFWQDGLKVVAGELNERKKLPIEWVCEWKLQHAHPHCRQTIQLPFILFIRVASLFVLQARPKQPQQWVNWLH